MTSDPFDPFEPKEQTKASAVRARAIAPGSLRDSGSSSSSMAEAAGPVAGAVSTASPAPAPTLGAVAAQATTSKPRTKRVKSAGGQAAGKASGPSLRDRLQGPGGRVVGFMLAFGIAGIAALFLLVAVAMGFSSSYTEKILPGVHVGQVDLGGETRDQAAAKLQAAYAYLSQGEVTVETPVGSATITYAQAGRGPDVQAMANAAMAVGHTGDPIADTAAALRAATGSQTIPIIVRVDPSALAARIHQVVGSSEAAARDAQATTKDGTFSVTPAASGKGVDEKAISTEIIDQLTSGDAPADIKAGGTYVALEPQVTDKEAQDAVDHARKMVVDVTVTWDTKSWTIPAATIQSWIVFGTKSDGTYGPAVDPSQVAAFLSGAPSKANIPAEKPTVVWDKTGNKPIGLNLGKDGTGIDITGTTQSVAAYLDALANGGSTVASIPVTTAAVHAQITQPDLNGLVIIGSWTTTFYPDVSNGKGANIRVPAKLLNGDVIAPGQQFSFLREVGPIDVAHGFAMGGVILNGKSDHTGAIGGGICSASTTMFNAAARAGLQIDERHAHFYYINRYPSGLDATVYADTSRTWDLKWTNDTPNPIIVRGYTTYGSRSTITFQLWSLPVDRQVKFNGVPAAQFKGGVATNVAKATDGKQYVGVASTIKPGNAYRAEYPTNGFDTTVTRTVTDASGNVLHTNTWASHYTKVDGVLQVGGTAPPSGSPTPSPTPTPGPGTPTPAPTPAPTPVPATPTPTPKPAATAAPSARRRRPRAA
jgi:vancomycin resistance protein YoaR